MTETSITPSIKTLPYAVVMDIVLVVIFAVSGRSSHHESLSVGGVFTTAWPFLAALAAGWLITRNWRAPVRLWPNGVCIWLITVAGGMALRILSGETAALPFVAVTIVVLALFLLGSRMIATLVTRRTARR
ncbi:DUF3054 domain-containing protein [Arthrobacter sp. ERGS1:01]|uniref:DUF3054 domain-containing protein n=1 Tax=Arthrobacter sp. ERGS1:01 TaxID=1704044 RepID=UPI000A529801|nr:DUF3054 domain-containing protein [Arthrobacter sp. ERGS1:01]